jgi:uncharacterized phage infection (PIP) family protein YhgE
MRISGRVFFPLLATIAVSVSLATPVKTFAGGAANAGASAAAKSAASPRPKPDEEKKIWTNDDFTPAGGEFQEIGAAGPTQTTSALPTTSRQAATGALQSAVASGPINPEQDLQWYAQQVAPLESELASVESGEQQLRNFRATGKGLPTGLNIAAPCEGVGTDNLIAQLEAQRQELLQQMDSLDDTARRSGLPPGIFVEGRGRVQVGNQMSPEEQRAAIAETYRERSDELEQTQETLAAMQAEAASKGVTLQLPALGKATNQTANLLDQLNNRAKELQSEIGNVEDDARHAGLDPGELR